MLFIRFHNKTKPKFEIKRISNKRMFPYIWRFTEFKDYPRFPFYSFSDVLNCKKNLFTAILKRKSERIKFKKINEDQLSTLLFYSSAVKKITINNNHFFSTFRMYPSAGARFPIEIYIAIPYRFGRLEKALYHYDPLNHGLTRLPSKNVNKQVIKKFVGEFNKKFVNNFAICIILTSVFYRTQLKYGNESGYRYSLIEAGHIGQNIYLVATALNLAVFSIGGYNDNYVNRFLNLDENIEQSVYLFLIGGKN